MTHSPAATDLTIVVVSYNTRELLRRCLRSLANFSCACTAEVVVVDNASVDGSVEMVREEFPLVRLMAQNRNLGYAAANNLVLAGLNSRYALVLNSDIEVRPGAVEALVSFMDAHPDAGMAGARLVLPGGAVQTTWAQGFTLGEFVRQQFYLDRLRPLETWQPAAAAEPVEVLHLHGACLIVRCEALEQVGLLDEGYFMYCEDSDWCRRFRQAGWKLFYVPAAEMLHHHGASSRQARAEMIAAYNLAAARYFRRHGGAWQGLAVRVAGFTGSALRLAAAAVLTAATVGLVPELRRRMALFGKAVRLQLRRGLP